MKGHNEKQKALMYDALVKLEEFRNEVGEYIEVKTGTTVTPEIHHVIKVIDENTCELIYSFVLDVNSGYCYPIFCICNPNEEGTEIEIHEYDGQKYSEDGESGTLEDLEQGLKELLSETIKFANSLGKEYSNE